MAVLRLRFVEYHSLSSSLIKAAQLGFPVTHVEAVFPRGYFGARLSGGVALRAVGYDHASMASERFIDLEATADQEKLFRTFLRTQIGTPYDWRAIIDLGLALVGIPLRISPVGAWSAPGRWECAGLMLNALIAAGLIDAGAFADRRHITPANLFFAVQGLARSLPQAA